MCKDCEAKDKVIAKLERVLKKAQVCDEEKYHRIKRLEGMIKNLTQQADSADVDICPGCGRRVAGTCWECVGDGGLRR